MVNVWPWNEIHDLKKSNESLSRANDRLHSLNLSWKDKEELRFLKKEIAKYITYDWSHNRFFSELKANRTLPEAESDLVKARYYIAVLEAQLGPNGVTAAHEVCNKLMALCNSK